MDTVYILFVQSGATENLVVMTKDKEKYQCILPEVASIRKHQVSDIFNI